MNASPVAPDRQPALDNLRALMMWLGIGNRARRKHDPASWLAQVAGLLPMGQCAVSETQQGKREDDDAERNVQRRNDHRHQGKENKVKRLCAPKRCPEDSHRAAADQTGHEDPQRKISCVWHQHYSRGTEKVPLYKAAARSGDFCWPNQPPARARWT